eukprot:NODE_180_length_3442_cov_78.608145.p1 GENE.NODE_180_length_3442_cov_78.608145~~NODE_180_length_3442_cov_78.608145.p1  ORF type:complete len:1046 (+),score=162.33 NODE_180_length_3442_cov_78.608145:106-3243(+)
MASDSPSTPNRMRSPLPRVMRKMRQLSMNGCPRGQLAPRTSVRLRAAVAAEVDAPAAPAQFRADVASGDTCGCPPEAYEAVSVSACPPHARDHGALVGGMRDVARTCPSSSAFEGLSDDLEHSTQPTCLQDMASPWRSSPVPDHECSTQQTAGAPADGALLGLAMQLATATLPACVLPQCPLSDPAGAAEPSQHATAVPPPLPLGEEGVALGQIAVRVPECGNSVPAAATTHASGDVRPFESGSSPTIAGKFPSDFESVEPPHMPSSAGVAEAATGEQSFVGAAESPHRASGRTSPATELGSRAKSIEPSGTLEHGVPIELPCCARSNASAGPCPRVAADLASRARSSFEPAAELPGEEPEVVGPAATMSAEHSANNASDTAGGRQASSPLYTVAQTRCRLTTAADHLPAPPETGGEPPEGAVEETATVVPTMPAPPCSVCASSQDPSLPSVARWDTCAGPPQLDRRATAARRPVGRVMSKARCSSRNRRASQKTPSEFTAPLQQTSAQLPLVNTSPRVVRLKRRRPEAECAGVAVASRRRCGNPRSSTPSRGFCSASRGGRHRLLWRPGFLRMDAVAEASPVDVEATAAPVEAGASAGLDFSPKLPNTSLLQRGQLAGESAWSSSEQPCSQISPAQCPAEATPASPVPPGAVPVPATLYKVSSTSTTRPFGLSLLAESLQDAAPRASACGIPLAIPPKQDAQHRHGAPGGTAPQAHASGPRRARAGAASAFAAHAARYAKTPSSIPPAELSARGYTATVLDEEEEEELVDDDVDALAPRKASRSCVAAAPNSGSAQLGVGLGRRTVPGPRSATVAHRTTRQQSALERCDAMAALTKVSGRRARPGGASAAAMNCHAGTARLQPSIAVIEDDTLALQSPTSMRSEASGCSPGSRMRRKPLLPEPVSALARAPALTPASAPQKHGTSTGEAVMEDSLVKLLPLPPRPVAPLAQVLEALKTRAFAPNAQATVEAEEPAATELAATAAGASEESAAAASLGGFRLVASVVVSGIRVAHLATNCHATPRRNSSASRRKRAGEQLASAAV